MLISCVYIVPILYLSCATPLFPAMHTQSGNKIDTTQAQDNFSFVYDIFAGPQPHLPQLYKSGIANIPCVYLVLCLCLSCVTILIARHTTRYPTTPPTTPPPCLTNLFPKYRKYPRCIVRPHLPTDDSSSNTHNSPHTFHIYVVPIICFSCVYIVSLHTAAYTSPEPIRRR